MAKLKTFENYDLTTLSDYWLCVASEIESAFIKGGVSETAYSARNLFEMAAPFVLARDTGQEEGLSFCISWPTVALPKKPTPAKWTAQHPDQASAPVDLQHLLKISDVEKMTTLKRSTIYEGIKNGTFPAPYKLSRRSVAWQESLVQAWINARKSS